jgi:hypothetical protein
MFIKLTHAAVIALVTLTACGKTTTEKIPDSGIPAIPSARLEEKPKAAPKAAMDEADQIASLIDPSKLATLRERGANPRIQKITAILWIAKTQGKNPEEITQTAVESIGWGGSLKGELTAASILRNLDIAEKLGSTTPEDVAAMRKGNAATVRRGPYAGDILSVDHILPRSIMTELDNVICNLELLPLRLNQSKGDSIGDRQRDLARKLYVAGLLEKAELPE